MGDKVGKEEKSANGGDTNEEYSEKIMLNTHCEKCASKIKRKAKNCQGVESVEVDKANNILTIFGHFKASALLLHLEAESHQKLEIVSIQPSSQKASTVVIKIRMDCDGCIKRVKKTILRIIGVEEINVNAEEDLVTVVGVMKVDLLSSSLKKEVNRSVEIVSETTGGGSGEGVNGGVRIAASGKGSDGGGASSRAGGRGSDGDGGGAIINSGGVAGNSSSGAVGSVKKVKAAGGEKPKETEGVCVAEKKEEAGGSGCEKKEEKRGADDGEKKKEKGASGTGEMKEVGCQGGGGGVTRHNSNALAGGNSSALAGGNSSALAGGNSSALAGGNSSALAGGNSNALAGRNSNAIAGGNRNALAGGSGSIGHRAGGGVVGGGGYKMNEEEEEEGSDDEDEEGGSDGEKEGSGGGEKKDEGVASGDKKKAEAAKMLPKKTLAPPVVVETNKMGLRRRLEPKKAP